MQGTCKGNSLCVGAGRCGEQPDTHTWVRWTGVGLPATSDITCVVNNYYCYYFFVSFTTTGNKTPAEPFLFNDIIDFLIYCFCQEVCFRCCPDASLSVSKITYGAPVRFPWDWLKCIVSSREEEFFRDDLTHNSQTISPFKPAPHQSLSWPVHMSDLNSINFRVFRLIIEIQSDRQTHTHIPGNKNITARFLNNLA